MPAIGMRAMLRPRYARYLLASATALGLDCAVFLLLIETAMPPGIAAGVGYAAGIGAHWLMSSRLVFTGAVATGGAAVRRQQLLFLLSALVGLGLTMLLVGTGAALGLDPRLAKLAAIAVSFQTTWLLRRHVVFRV